MDAEGLLLLAMFTDMAAKAVAGAAILLAACSQRACCFSQSAA